VVGSLFAHVKKVEGIKPLFTAVKSAAVIPLLANVLLGEANKFANNVVIFNAVEFALVTDVVLVW
jgi:hypothetical protein